jgi:ATP-dependent exoDNAse (exonuclease V) alpha subunit
VVVKLDSGQTVSVPVKKYDGLRIGYAVTTHKGQGTTVERAYIMTGGTMTDRALSYVQGSRVRDAAHIYTDKFEAGDKLSQLAKQMSLDREKTLAHSILAKPKEEQKNQQTIEIRQERTL